MDGGEDDGNMRGPRNTEPQANGALARALRRRNPDWTDKTVYAERTNVIQQATSGSGAAKRPGILIDAPLRQPVIVETEFAPAHTVEQDATARLGTSLHSTGEDRIVPEVGIDPWARASLGEILKTLREVDAKIPEDSRFLEMEQRAAR